MMAPTQSNIALINQNRSPVRQRFVNFDDFVSCESSASCDPCQKLSWCFPGSHTTQENQMTSTQCPKCHSHDTKKQSVEWDQSRRLGPRYASESGFSDRVRPPTRLSVVLVPAFFYIFCWLAEELLFLFARRLDFTLDEWRLSLVDSFDLIGIIGAAVFAILALAFNRLRLPKLRQKWDDSAWICRRCGQQFTVNQDT